jgi:hypothetical protein
MKILVPVIILTLIGVRRLKWGLGGFGRMVGVVLAAVEGGCSPLVIIGSLVLAEPKVLILNMKFMMMRLFMKLNRPASNLMLRFLILEMMISRFDHLKP